MVQWKEELRTVDDRVRTIVGVKDQARTGERADPMGGLCRASFESLFQLHERTITHSSAEVFLLFYRATSSGNLQCCVTDSFDMNMHHRMER